MRKSEAKPAIQQFIRSWLRAQGFPHESKDEPSSIGFFAWMQNNHPEFLRFRTTIDVEYDIGMWFDEEVAVQRKYWAAVRRD